MSGEGEGAISVNKITFNAGSELAEKGKRNINSFDCQSFICKSTSFLKGETKKRGSDLLIVPLSGGVDSAVVLALCKKTGLKIHAVTIIGKPMRSLDIKHSKVISKTFCVSHELIDVSNVYETLVPFGSALDIDHLFMGVRNTFLREVSTKQNGVLVGGGNKTEKLSGLYCQNSIVGQIFPLANIFKTQVFKLANFLNIPNCVLNKKSHCGIKGRKDDLFWGLGHEAFDVASVTLDTFPDSLDLSLKEKLIFQKRYADSFFKFPEL